MKLLKRFLNGVLIASTLFMLVPIEVSAQSYRDRFRSSEGSEIDFENIREWRERNNAIRDAINDLGDKPVTDLPIPILFGVSVGDLVPNFGDPRDGGARTHQGLDMLVGKGTPIVSPTDAVVIRIGSGSSSGNYVTTANPGDETYVYMHLDEVADIDEGDQLETGDLIGYVGNTGNAAGGPAHLHFELRENRRASNPLPRLTDEFSLQEKMRFVENMLDEVRNDEELATFLAGEYLGEFVRAQAQGISIPRLVAERLPGSLADGSSPSRDLTIESEGVDVSVLQSILIAKGHLAIDAPTGYFGPLTEAALALYQRENGISPAAGYFGPITRAHMFGVSQATSLAVRRAELQQTLDKLLLQVEALQRELAALSS